MKISTSLSVAIAAILSASCGNSKSPPPPSKISTSAQSFCAATGAYVGVMAREFAALAAAAPDARAEIQRHQRWTHPDAGPPVGVLLGADVSLCVENRRLTQREIFASQREEQVLLDAYYAALGLAEQDPVAAQRALEKIAAFLEKVDAVPIGDVVLPP